MIVCRANSSKAKVEKLNSHLEEICAKKDTAINIPCRTGQNVRSNFYIIVLPFIFYVIKIHKPDQVLYIIFKYIYQRYIINLHLN